MSGFTSNSAPFGWDNAYFQPAQPAYTGTDPGMGYYDALAGKPGASGTPAWGEKLTKALGDLSKANAAGQQSQGGGGGSSRDGGMAPAQSGTGGGRGANLDALVQLLQQRYTQLYPGGGSSKGLLGV